MVIKNEDIVVVHPEKICGVGTYPEISRQINWVKPPEREIPQSSLGKVHHHYFIILLMKVSDSPITSCPCLMAVDPETEGCMITYRVPLFADSPIVRSPQVLASGMTLRSFHLLFSSLLI
jgi:hypothetical protein